MNTISEMTTLAVQRPNGDDPQSVADWYAAKCRLHEHLAAMEGAGSREWALAAAAREHANLLRRAI